MKRKNIITIILALVAMTAGAQNVDMNNQELARLQQKAEARVKNQQKQLSPYDANSRGKALNPMLPDCRDVSKFKTIDQASVRISYAFNARNVADPKTYDDLQRLEIGNKFVKYYGFYVYEADSVATAELQAMNRITHSNMPFPDEGVAMSQINGKHQGWSRNLFSEILKDLTKNELTEYCRMPEALRSYDCYYTEPTPKQNWQIGNETKTIVGYQCQKATCHWRGRDFVAWFAPDIPVKRGPWRFNGLPGLILEAEADGIHRFTIADIQRKASPIYYETNAITVKTTEAKLIKMRIKTFGNRLYLKNPKYYVGDLSTADVTHDTEGILVNNVYVNNKAHVYQPLELE